MFKCDSWAYGAGFFCDDQKIIDCMGFFLVDDFSMLGPRELLDRCLV